MPTPEYAQQLLLLSCGSFESLERIVKKKIRSANCFFPAFTDKFTASVVIRQKSIKTGCAKGTGIASCEKCE